MRGAVVVKMKDKYAPRHILEEFKEILFVDRDTSGEYWLLEDKVDATPLGDQRTIESIVLHGKIFRDISREVRKMKDFEGIKPNAAYIDIKTYQKTGTFRGKISYQPLYVSDTKRKS